jgi:hypothetical protein
MAQKHLRYKAALHPLLFELLHSVLQFPHLQNMYEEVYATNLTAATLHEIVVNRFIGKTKRKRQIGF